MSRKVAAELAKNGIAFIDAPVSGGPKGAATGTMSMVIGAEDADLARAMPILEGMSGTRVHVGNVAQAMSPRSPTTCSPPVT